MKADQLSQTAAFVAIKFYGLTLIKEFRNLFDDSTIAFYEQLVQALPAPIRYYHFWLQFGWVRKLYIWSEELMLPGDLLHVVARKWCIEQQAAQLINEGYEQLFVLGSGFDHLAWHFSRQGISCIEFDVPHMIKLKGEFLSTHYPDNNLSLVPLHFPHNDLENKFENHPEIDPHKKTIVVAEGFFDYLEPETVSASLQVISGFFLNEPAIISTHFALDELSLFHRWVFNGSVSMVGEQLKFSTPISEYKKMLQGNGFDIEYLYNNHQIREQLAEKTTTKLGVLNGFYLLLAKRQ